MKKNSSSDISEIVGGIQYRLALAGGWIDQPFMSRHNPDPPGSMVVAAVEPEFRFMDRAGICGSTRSIALKLWGGTLPDGDPAELVRTLYETENKDKKDPSGSQDMIGIIYPGINRLDYDCEHEGGYFPKHIESNTDPDAARWLGEHLHLLPVNTRPPGYNPLGRQHITPEWAARLGRSGKACFDAISSRDAAALGASFNECMTCWRTMLPDTVEHHTLDIDLVALLEFYQDRSRGAMYSGCGGGYLIVVSENPVPGGFQVTFKPS